MGLYHSIACACVHPDPLLKLQPLLILYTSQEYIHNILLPHHSLFYQAWCWHIMYLLWCFWPGAAWGNLSIQTQHHHLPCGSSPPIIPKCLLLSTHRASASPPLPFLFPQHPLTLWPCLVPPAAILPPQAPQMPAPANSPTPWKLSLTRRAFSHIYRQTSLLCPVLNLFRCRKNVHCNIFHSKIWILKCKVIFFLSWFFFNLFMFKIALLRYNWYTKTCIYLMCAIWWAWIYAI